jgi:hypothetical protein
MSTYPTPHQMSEDHAATVNHVCRKLAECAGELRCSKWEHIVDKWEPTSLNKVAAILDDLHREVCRLADSEYTNRNGC